MHRIVCWLAIFLVGGACLSGTAAAQQGSGIRYRVTTRMEMVGMPFQMPTQTQEMCGPKNSASEAMVPKRDNCQVLDYKVVGNKSSFRMECTGRDAMSGTGEFVYGKDGYQGKMTVNADGKTMQMTFDGKKLGECDYATQGPKARVNAALAQTCDGLLAGQPEGLAGASAQFAPGALCAAQKPRYCAKIAPLATNLPFLRDADATVAAYRKQGLATANSGWDGLALCGQSRAQVLVKACSKAEAAGDYDFIGDMCPGLLDDACDRADANKNASFVAGRCPARAAKLAAAQCANRGYTAMASSPYREFCSAYAGQQLRARNGGNDAGDSVIGKPVTDQPTKKPSWKDKLKLKDRLKNMIGG